MGTTKARFIELHGEEAWEIESKRRNENYKKWRINNLDKKKEYDKNYYNENKEIINERHRNYGIIYYSLNKTKLLIKSHNYRLTINGRAVSLATLYRKKDKERGFDTSNNINYTWIVDNIFSGQKCYKCGETDWTKLGCDRIDNTKPHTPDNVLCCCKNCNLLRSDKYTVEEFLSLPMKAVINSPRINIGEDGSLKKLCINR